MRELEDVGWVRAEKKKTEELSEMDCDQIFDLIDVDRSGAVSRSVGYTTWLVGWSRGG